MKKEGPVVDDCAPPGMRHVFTVGHSNHPIGEFISLLKAHGIEVLADVRSQPYSKYVPQFNSNELKAALVSEGIKYVFMGKELGGHPTEPSYYDADGYVLYSRLAESPRFLEGISRLEKGIREYRVAIMCSEEDPSECHRRLLVGRVVVKRGFALSHIRGNGSVQTEDELLEEEMRRGLHYVQAGLFQAEEEVEWKSTRSVSRREQQQDSLEH